MSSDELVQLAKLKSRKPLFTNMGAEMYGAGAIWREYGYYPKWLPLWVEATHSTTQYLFLADKDIHTFFKNAFVYTERHKNIYDQISRSSCYHTPSPFVLYKQLRNIRQDPDCKGTVVFFGHSVRKASSSVDINQYLVELNALPEEMKPITVCLHYLDINNKSHETLIANGVRCVTAGNAFHDEFIPRFYDIIRSHKYAVSNTWTSAMLYCADLGLPVSIYGSEPIWTELKLDDKVRNKNKGVLYDWYAYLRYKHIDWFSDFFRNNYPADLVAEFYQAHFTEDELLEHYQQHYTLEELAEFKRNCEQARLHNDKQLRNYRDPNLNYIYKLFRGITQEISSEQSGIVDIELGNNAEISRFRVSFLLYQSLILTPFFFLSRLLLDKEERSLLYKIFIQKVLSILKKRY